MRNVDKETGLTPQQEQFALHLAKTGNASEAYRQAYPRQKMNPNALAVAACRLAAKPKVALRLSALRSDVRKRSGITLADHLAELERLKRGAEGADQYGAAITAEVSRGKVSGLYEGTADEGDAPAPVNVTVNIVDGRK